METKRLLIRAVTDGDRDWVRSLLQDRWGAETVVSRGRLHHAGQLPGFVAIEAEQPVGLVTYAFDNEECEIVSLDALQENKGVGSALIKAVLDLARDQRCKRVWLITTNDNTRALRFFQKAEFMLAAIHCNAIMESRRMKPSIPERGCDGIPIRDEIELEMRLR
jgi:N-acetylglutamate synthase-like GNAT family acetyltransferase